MKGDFRNIYKKERKRTKKSEKMKGDFRNIYKKEESIKKNDFHS